MRLQVHHCEVVKHRKDLFDRLGLNRVYLGPVLGGRGWALCAPHDSVDKSLSCLLPLEFAEYCNGLLWRVQSPKALLPAIYVIRKHKLYQLHLLQQTIQYLAKMLKLQFSRSHHRARLRCSSVVAACYRALHITNGSLALRGYLWDKDVASLPSTS